MNDNQVMLPFELEYFVNGRWQPYGRYATKPEVKEAMAEAIWIDKSNDFSCKYRILETKVIE